ncbi:MAG: hypothetical protein A2139_02390 [Desulfobacca sp. RBG_16_60_12]|nr:MAG: hypothetical protein A2139_02390 [Desulfobacca sp. RBG_16_60_12]
MERAVETSHTDQQGAVRWLHQAQALDLLLDGNLERGALQDAGQPVDNQAEPEQYMPLDSADLRLAKAKERH